MTQDKPRSTQVLKDHIDEAQSPTPTTTGMNAKEIGVLIIVMVIAFVVYAIYKMS